MINRFILLLAAFLMTQSEGFSQTELLINGGAELDPPANGWTIVNMGDGNNVPGFLNWRAWQNTSNQYKPRTGTYFFTPGRRANTTIYPNGTTYEIYQDVDVSAYVTGINAGNQSFTFSGWMQAYKQTPQDSTRFIVEYRNSADDVLEVYNTGKRGDGGVWTKYEDTRNAPVGTRKIRVRVIGYVYSGAYIDSYFDDLSLTANSSLPVTLRSFNVFLDQGKVMARWQTETESNSSYFELQRSADALKWETVTEVRASGHSAVALNYAAEDDRPDARKSYYRLVMYDLDGSMTYSDIERVQADTTNTGMRLYPNPALGYVILESDHLNLRDLRIYNAAGINMTGKVHVLGNSDQRIQLDVSGLNPGSYFIKAGEATVSFMKR